MIMFLPSERGEVLRKLDQGNNMAANVRPYVNLQDAEPITVLCKILQIVS